MIGGEQLSARPMRAHQTHPRMGIRTQQHVTQLVREHMPQELRHTQFSPHSETLYSVVENPCVTPEPLLAVFDCVTEYVSPQREGLRLGEW